MNCEDAADICSDRKEGFFWRGSTVVAHSWNWGRVERHFSCRRVATLLLIHTYLLWELDKDGEDAHPLLLLHLLFTPPPLVCYAGPINAALAAASM